MEGSKRPFSLATKIAEENQNQTTYRGNVVAKDQI